MYIGRFAPSPTGPLHFGSLVAAVASYLDARVHKGHWLVRIEDLDTDRVRPGADQSILRDLEKFGMTWDGPIVYQTARLPFYEAAFAKLSAAGLIYPCACSRKEAVGQYAGVCRRGLGAGKAPRSWRLHVSGCADIAFTDRFCGPYRQNVAESIGDFIVRRADGPFAYQLAVVVDDAAQNVTDVVRGADLLDNTPRQIYLQHCLGLPTPRYAHVRVATDQQGVKLSKSSGAAALNRNAASLEMERALQFLGYALPADLRGANVAQLLRWATQEPYEKVTR